MHDEEVFRTSACGLAGLSVVADSLSAIKYAKVTPIRNEEGLITDFEIEGDYPKFGNNDPAVDEIASGLVKNFMKKLSRHKTYRNSKPTMSILTITSNVVYGKKPALHRTAEKRASRLHRVQIRCTARQQRVCGIYEVGC